MEYQVGLRVWVDRVLMLAAITVMCLWLHARGWLRVGIGVEQPLLTTPAPRVPTSAGVFDEFVLTYLGQSTCPVCSGVPAKQAVRELQDLVRLQAEESNVALRIKGVALDWDIETGIKFLSEMGGWTEVAVGDNWFGDGAWDHIWSVAVDGAVPQVVLYHRRFVVGAGVDLRRLGEAEVARFTGLDELQHAVGTPDSWRIPLARHVGRKGIAQGEEVEGAEAVGGG